LKRRIALQQPPADPDAQRRIDVTHDVDADDGRAIDVYGSCRRRLTALQGRQDQLAYRAIPGLDAGDPPGSAVSLDADARETVTSSCTRSEFSQRIETGGYI
jgi:hypothetical protein